MFTNTAREKIVLNVKQKITEELLNNSSKYNSLLVQCKHFRNEKYFPNPRKNFPVNSRNLNTFVNNFIIFIFIRHFRFSSKELASILKIDERSIALGKARFHVLNMMFLAEDISNTKLNNSILFHSLYKKIHEWSFVEFWKSFLEYRVKTFPPPPSPVGG